MSNCIVTDRSLHQAVRLAKSPAVRRHSPTSTTSSASAQDANRTGILTALFLMGFGTFVNLYATQPVLPTFRHLFGASELMVSLTVSAPVLAIAIMAPIIGSLADSIGRKRIICTAMFGVAVPTLLVATSANLTQLIIWRMLQGLFIPGIIAVGMAYISEESPKHLTGSTMATYVSGSVAGGFCGRFLSGLLTPVWGWRTAFVIIGLLTVVSAALTLALLPRSTKFVRQNNAGESFRNLVRHLSNRQLLATYAVGFNVLFAVVGAFTYVNFYLADKPFLLGPVGLASIFLVYLVGSVITPYSGKALDRIGCRRGVVLAAGLAALGMLLTLIQWLPAVILGLTLAASGAFACQSAASSNVGKSASKARSAATGLYVAFYYFGGFVGSALPGFFWHHAGWAGCVAIIIAMQSITAFIAQRLWKD
jgi:MFS transporter, YNFM family, putative membrane transport protein